MRGDEGERVLLCMDTCFDCGKGKTAELQAGTGEPTARGRREEHDTVNRADRVTV